MKNLGINFYHFLPTHLSTILLRKHGLISKSTSKRYYQVAILFTRLFCPFLVSIDYTLKVSEADKTFMKAMAKFEGVSLSELIRTKTLEALEDEYDARVADLA